MSNRDRTSRREFLKNAAVGAVVLGAGGKIALAKASQTTGKSKVVIARDPALRGPDGAPEGQRVVQLLDKAMMAFADSTNPVQPWKQIVRPGQTVSIKVNTIAGKGLSTHLALALAVCERLQQVGIKPGDIIIWDRTNRELERAGYTVSTDANRLRCFGTDTAGFGYAEEQSSYGAVKTNFSKILTSHCDVMINLPVLKDHSMAGVTLAMKNMYGVIQNPSDQHGGGCNPYVADLNMLPAIRQKMRLTIADAMTALYEGGPGYRPENTWSYNGLLVAQDPVALDYTGWQIIERKRAEVGLKTLDAVGRPPRYIATAADATHQLGTDDPKRMDVVGV
jgi:uncharacterized protein (DUF362 family)